jgi:hypothetical protein
MKIKNGDNNVAVKKQKKKKGVKVATQELFFQASSIYFINFKNCIFKIKGSVGVKFKI